ncbi:MAG: undecaprenyl-diphosphate phosphatase [Clostridiales bacterium]|nr:undecaprenyl-diphosphate phosphatase [Clostridiales bacterium]
MKIWFAALIGFVQGVTEFLPVSSSGHLSVLQNLFGMENVEEGHLFFDVLLHLATLVSVCVVYWQDIKDMVKEFFGFFHDLRHPKPEDGDPKPARRMVFMIIIALLPLFIALPFQSLIEKLYYNTLFIGFAFLVTGVILFVTDRLKTGRKTAANMTVKDALIVGACQAVATIPGISRSGSTISAGMATGLERSYAVKFSFLLSLPAILGANILQLFKAIGGGIDFSLVPAYLVGMVVAGITGYFAINLVKMLSRKGKFGKFCYYCFAAGIATIVLSFIF